MFTNNKIGCLLEKASKARPFKENIKKLYITKKLENKITFYRFCFDRHARAIKYNTGRARFTELPAKALPQTFKQTGLQQSVDDRLFNCERLFIYTHWLLKVFFEVGQQKIFNFLSRSGMLREKCFEFRNNLTLSQTLR